MNHQHRSFAASRFFAVVALFLIFVGGTAQAASVFTPIRPPSVPLITRSPYVSTWLNADNAVGSWPTFWNGNTKSITGMVSIDGSAYVFLGAPAGVPRTMTQASLQVTPTQSIYTFDGGGVRVTLDFLSPVDAADMKRLSIPLSYMTASAKSSDGKTHTVKLYFDVSGEWAHGDSSAQIIWAKETISLGADGSGTPGSLSAWEVAPASPSVLKETNEYPDWGTALLATVQQPGLTSQSGSATTVRNQFITKGVLTTANDTNYRAINDNYPVFAYSLNLGTVGSTAPAPWTLALGHVRDPAVSYQGQPVPPLWKSYFGTYQNMLAFSLNDYGSALGRAGTLDNQVTAAATQVGGMHYAAICTLALRQAFAGTELVDPTKMMPTLNPALPDGDPWLFVKEISSSGNVSTVDIAYPAFPAFLYTNPELVRLMIDPLIYYPESGRWPQPFAEHDIGASYPNADGHNDGGGENMPVEETANMLIMADAYMRYTPVPGRASAYAQTHYAIFKQWADYLLSTPNGVNMPNALDPQFQNQTDDFTGSISHSVNLSLKGIIAVGAMGQIAAYDGNMADASYYTAQARALIAQWVKLSQNSDSTHLLLQYQEAANPYSPDTTGEPNSAWSLKYNAFPDRLLGTNLIPASIHQEEAAFDTTREQQYGIPLDYRNSYTKTDWELWAVASTDDTQLRQDVFDGIYNAFNTTPDRVPFTDWYEPSSGRRTGFLARPVIGGVFAALFSFTAAPILSPAGGTFTSPQTVTITAATPGSVIYYTTDGSMPNANSPVYSGPLLVSNTQTVQAVAVVGGSQVSPTAGATYTLLTPPLMQNGSFETPSVAAAFTLNSYQYNPSGGGWTFNGYSGIQANGSAWNGASAPDGVQTAFLQGYPSQGGAADLGSIAQSVNFTSTGSYVLSFQAARREGSLQPLSFSVDGVQIGGLLTPASSSFGPLTTPSFSIRTAGRHTITLSATDNSGDKSTFIDKVSLFVTTLPTVSNGSFETPRVGSGGYLYNPTGGGWAFDGTSGIQANGSAWGAADATDGTQTAFLQGYPAQRNPTGFGVLGSISQALSFSGVGTYALTFQAAQRQGQIQPLKFSVDGVQVGDLLTPVSSSFGLLRTAPFSIGSAGTHTITLSATDNSGDKSTLVDQAKLTVDGQSVAPTITAATGGSGQVKITWTAGPLTGTYNVYRGTTARGEAAAPIAMGIKGTTYFDSGLTNGTTYFYQVAAVTNLGVSDLSNEASAMPRLLLPTSEANGSSWNYVFATPPSTWFASAFDDSAWASGLAGFGSINFGGSVSRTPWTDTPGDIWIRRHFPVTGTVPANQQFRIFYDEDCEIYINGTLAGSATGYVTSYVSLPMTAAGQAALKVGDNVIAVHCHQTMGGQYIDVGIQTAL